MNPKSLISKAKKPLKILFVAVEVAPFAPVGGLSQVMFYLPKELKAMGRDVKIFMPKFGAIDEELLKKMNPKMVHEGLRVPVGKKPINGNGNGGSHELICNVKSVVVPDSDVEVCFIENMEYYEMRANVYGYADDPIRWGLFQKGILEFLSQSIDNDENAWIPDVIHCNDWQTGLIPNYLKSVYRQNKKLSGIISVYTIHNLAFQSNFHWRDVTELDYDDGKSEIPSSIFEPRFAKLNSMRRGIMYADAVNTVSQTYSREILTPDFGEGLDRLLIELRDKFYGILNGLDYEDFNPETDKIITHNYNLKNVHTIRPLNKKALQAEFGLPKDNSSVVLGVSGRLTGQKGINLIVDVLHTVLAEYPVQIVVNGDGDSYFKDRLIDFRKDFPKQVGLNLSSNFTLPRHIFAGADIMLMPSFFEPCGIVQMEAMRYGAVPVAREVGGLADTIEDGYTGFTFTRFEPLAFFGTLIRALEIYKHRDMWMHVIENCMAQDYSWNNSANKYLNFYEKADYLKEVRKDPKILQYMD